MPNGLQTLFADHTQATAAYVAAFSKRLHTFGMGSDGGGMDLKVGSRPKNIENTLSTDNRNRPNLAIEGFGRSNPTSDLPEFRANSTKISGKFC